MEMRPVPWEGIKLHSDNLSGVESNVTEGVANGDEYIFSTTYERQKHIRIRDVRLGLNPIDLLPEKTDEARHFGVMQSETRTKVHECADLPRRYRSFKHIAVPKSLAR